MKLTKIEWATLAVTLLTLTAMVFYYLGSRSVAQPVTVTAADARPSVTVEASVSEETPEPSPAAEPSPEAAFPIDLNNATVDELMLLPSIGEVRAKAIVEYREENGPFRYVEDLRGVKGIGEGILAQIMDYVTVNEGEANG